MDCKKFVIYDHILKPQNNKGIFTQLFNLLPIAKILNKPIHTIFKGIKADKNHIYKYISYNNFETTKTKIPEGSKLRKKLPQKFINDYYCGSKITAKEDKQVLQKHKKSKVYYIQLFL